jgi:MFS family permease
VVASLLPVAVAVLVAGRAVQGLGAGVMVTLLYVIAGQAYAGALRPRLFGAISAAWVLPALIGPLIVWLLKREQPFVSDHSREALNFNLSVLIYFVAATTIAV